MKPAPSSQDTDILSTNLLSRLGLKLSFLINCVVMIATGNTDAIITYYEWLSSLLLLCGYPYKSLILPAVASC